MTERADEIFKGNGLELELNEKELEDYDSSPPIFRISTYPADFTLRTIYEQWKENSFEVPRFQRGFVWTIKQSSRLIESFLHGLPVPPVYLFKEEKTNKLLIIDGQQRLKSIVYFFEGKFGEGSNNREFKLTGLHPQSPYLGKTFDDLNSEDRRRLEIAVLRSFIVEQIDPKDQTSSFHVFERLNTGGTLLTNQEIRVAIYYSPFVEMLHEINRYEYWRQILGRNNPDVRLRDEELILRVLALFHEGPGAYQKPMKDFLNKYMDKARRFNYEDIDRLRSLLKKTCKQVVDCLGQKPFHRRNSVGVAVLDAVMYAFAIHLESGSKIPENVKDRYERLLKDEEFQKRISQFTTDEQNVRERIQIAQKFLFD